MVLVFGAWIEMHQKLANYNAVAAAPWTEASKRFLEAMSAATAGGSNSPPNWREAVLKWREIFNKELIRKQSGDEFLRGHKEILKTGPNTRRRQAQVAAAAS